MNTVEIAMILKNIPLEIVLKEWSKIKELTRDEISNLNGRSRLGCDLIDHYFFKNRLETIGNKGIHFFDFLANITFYKSKKYIQTLLTFCEKSLDCCHLILNLYLAFVGIPIVGSFDIIFSPNSFVVR